MTAPSSTTKRRLLGGVLGLVSLAAAIIGWQASRQTALRAPAEIEDFVYWQAKDLAAFSLAGAGGRSIAIADLKGRWSFVFFGYTHCPDICPTTMSVLAQAFRLLETDPDIAAELQGLFVSVDPARDSPESLKDYVAFFDPRIVGVTGGAEQLGAFARQFGALYTIHAPQSGKAADDYLVTHNSTIFLVDPRARLHGRLPPPHDPHQIAEAFLRIRDFDRDRSSRRWSIL